MDDRDNARLLPTSGSAYSALGGGGNGGGYDLSDPGYVGGGDPFAGNGSDDDDDAGQMHYGPVPSRVPRRNKTVKKIQLFMGHLVLDCPVPRRLLDQCRERDDKEFEVMRYTAVTCDPDQFKCAPPSSCLLLRRQAACAPGRALAEGLRLLARPSRPLKR